MVVKEVGGVVYLRADHDGRRKLTEVGYDLWQQLGIKARQGEQPLVRCEDSFIVQLDVAEARRASSCQGP
eukprot:1238434-Amphidinium_carterae.1